jgi:cation diffusion facilitator CzcD-associated flavoprotein CzcO
VTNKRVVVVGSAASAVQIVPVIAQHAKHVTCIQRTPNWLAPQQSPILPPRLVFLLCFYTEHMFLGKILFCTKRTTRFTVRLVYRLHMASWS